MSALGLVKSSELVVGRKKMESTNYKLPTNNSPGFTLVELLVVIAVIAILSVIGMVVFQGISSKANSAKRMSDLDAIKKAYEANYDSTGYKTLTGANFASGKIPTPDNPNQSSYFAVGPNVGTSTSPTPNYAICASKSGNTNCATDPTNPDCYCLKSDQGEAIDFYFSSDNLLNSYNSSFENGTGEMADGWIKNKAATTSITYAVTSGGVQGQKSQSVYDALYNEGISSVYQVELTPNTKYTLSAYIRLTKADPGYAVLLGALVNGHRAGNGASTEQVNTSFQKLEFTFDTTQDTPPIRFSPFIFGEDGGGGKVSFDVDNIQLIQTP